MRFEASCGLAVLLPFALGACSPNAVGAAPPATDEAGAKMEAGSTAETGSTAEADVAPPQGQPPGFKDGVSLVEAVDKNPDPHIVEIDLEARVGTIELSPGNQIQALTYNGSCPGPLIRAKAGDRVIVHFKNSLATATTIHWHGVRVPANMDGTPSSQDPVTPGASFDYDFRVPDAGLYWYHPHMDSAALVAQGLYGALVVEDDSEPRELGDEVVMMLSDIEIGDGGRAKPPPPDTLIQLFGSEGHVILVNGRTLPRLVARAGLRQRWRFVNAAMSRYFELSLAGHTFVRIGGDGGLLETSVETDTLVIAPGERADVSMVPRGQQGTDIKMRWIPYDRGYGSAFGRRPEDILTLHTDAAEPVTPAELPGHLRTISPIDTNPASPVSILLSLTPGDAGADAAALQINGRSFETMVMAKVGDTNVWTVENQTDWDHPFHLHGFFFQPLDGEGRPLHEWKDTLNVPTKKSRSFVVRYDDRPGNWMFHCHILEHAEIGMMGMLMLER